MRIPGWMLSFALIVGLAMIARAQSSPAAPNPYTPTEVQALRLKVAQQSAQLAQSQLREAQQAFQSALANLNAEAEKVKKENGWGDDIGLNMDTLQFGKINDPSKKVAPPAAKKEERKP